MLSQNSVPMDHYTVNLIGTRSGGNYPMYQSHKRSLCKHLLQNSCEIVLGENLSDYERSRAESIIFIDKPPSYFDTDRNSQARSTRSASRRTKVECVDCGDDIQNVHSDIFTPLEPKNRFPNQSPNGIINYSNLLYLFSAQIENTKQILVALSLQFQEIVILIKSKNLNNQVSFEINSISPVRGYFSEVLENPQKIGYVTDYYCLTLTVKILLYKIIHYRESPENKRKSDVNRISEAFDILIKVTDPHNISDDPTFPETLLNKLTKEYPNLVSNNTCIKKSKNFSVELSENDDIHHRYKQKFSKWT
jgi:hypothetical protein